MSRNVDLATRLKVLLCVPAPAKSFYRRFLPFYRLKFKHFRRFLFLIYFTMYLETTFQVERKVVQVSRNRKVLLVSCDYFSVGVSSPWVPQSTTACGTLQARLKSLQPLCTIPTTSYGEKQCENCELPYA